MSALNSRMSRLASCHLLTLAAAVSNRGMNWERHSNCPLALGGLNKTLAGPAGKAYASRWPEMTAMAANPTCNPVNDTVAHNHVPEYDHVLRRVGGDREHACEREVCVECERKV